jgi:DNA-binding FadR family transcriptional regulator
MTDIDNTQKRLMQTGLFRTENDAVKFMIARIINDNISPIGAWTLKEKLTRQGLDYGTATVGRYLKELDSQSLTIQQSNQGRILTEHGKHWLSDISNNVARAQIHNKTSKALKIDNYSDLIDLIQARKAIEVTGVSLAVNQATEEDLSRLKQSVINHYRCVAEKQDPTESALNFHLTLAEISHNRFIKAILDMLVFEEESIENNMNQLITRDRGDIYVVEHDDTAIVERNEKKATSLMTHHMDALLSAVREQIELMSNEDHVS